MDKNTKFTKFNNKLIYDALEDGNKNFFLDEQLELFNINERTFDFKNCEVIERLNNFCR